MKEVTLILDCDKKQCQQLCWAFMLKDNCTEIHTFLLKSLLHAALHTHLNQDVPARSVSRNSECIRDTNNFFLTTATSQHKTICSCRFLQVHNSSEDPLLLHRCSPGWVCLVQAPTEPGLLALRGGLTLCSSRGSTTDPQQWGFRSGEGRGKGGSARGCCDYRWS